MATFSRRPVTARVSPRRQERVGEREALMKNLNGSILTIVTTLCVLSGSSLAQMVTPQQPPPDAATTPLFVNVQDLKWKIGCPELGDRSGAVVILHVDPKTQATQL